MTKGGRWERPEGGGDGEYLQSGLIKVSSKPMDLFQICKKQFRLVLLETALKDHLSLPCRVSPDPLPSGGGETCLQRRTARLNFPKGMPSVWGISSGQLGQSPDTQMSSTPAPASSCSGPTFIISLVELIPLRDGLKKPAAHPFHF